MVGDLNIHLVLHDRGFRIGFPLQKSWCAAIIIDPQWRNWPLNIDWIVFIADWSLGCVQYTNRLVLIVGHLCYVTHPTQLWKNCFAKAARWLFKNIHYITLATETGSGSHLKSEHTLMAFIHRSSVAYERPLSLSPFSITIVQHFVLDVDPLHGD